MRASNILETIGDTPHVRINRLFGSDHEVWIKLERANPGGSIKDRIGLAMIEDAEKRGVLKPDTVIIEPTSGNTGIALAMVCAVKGYELVLVMPETMSIERRQQMAALGATIELTPKEEGLRGALDRAAALAADNPKAWVPQQFENPANPAIHRKTTGEEIARDFPEGLDVLITGVGTGGHISGVAETLKSRFSGLKVFAVEPAGSAILSGGEPGPHPLQGIGPGFVPDTLNRELLDGAIAVEAEEAFEMAVRCAKEEGIFLGISSGASLAAVRKKLPDLPKGTRVLTFCYDTGERYLSVEDLFPRGK